MSGNLWLWGVDYKGQPLLDAWWTRGWTSQNRNKASIQVPQQAFSAPGFPSGLSYTTVIGNYFDASANPLSGYLTFWPSDALTFTISGQTTYMPQRYSGINQTLIGTNQMGNSRIYLWWGQLNVSLLATDNANMTPASFSYHVKEHFIGGQQYDILVPGADGNVGTDIHNLIVPGTVCPTQEDFEDDNEGQDERISIPVSSSQYLAVDITTVAAGTNFVPTSYPVNLAFMTTATQPGVSDWQTAAWANNSGAPPYIATILIGPNGFALAAGTYKVWAQVVATPNVPVIPVGYVTIY